MNKRKIRTIILRKKEFRTFYDVFNINENRWKSINYQCGKMTLTKYQWFKLHSCFQMTITTTTLPGKKLIFATFFSLVIFQRQWYRCM